jgi:hypothetical protein
MTLTPQDEQRIREIKELFDSGMKHLTEYLDKDNSEKKKPKQGDTYWLVWEENEIKQSRFENDTRDKKRIKIGNYFLTEAAAEREILRRESMANRGEEPKKGELRWVCSLVDGRPYECGYEKSYYEQYLIGNIHKTKEACLQWAEKYRDAWENLSNQQ